MGVPSDVATIAGKPALVLAVDIRAGLGHTKGKRSAGKDMTFCLVLITSVQESTDGEEAYLHWQYQ